MAYSRIFEDSDLPVENGSNSTVASVGASGDQRIDGQLRGVKWADLSLSYSFPDELSDYGYSVSGFSALRPQQASTVQRVLEAPADPAYYGFSVEGLTNLDMSFAGFGSGSGTLRYANSSAAPTAYAYYPSNSISGGDSWYGYSGSNPVEGNYHYHAFMHETGHALGLKHGHETSIFGSLPYDTDSMEFSVMTYKSYVGSDSQYVYNETWGYAQTYMMYDIAALQYLYGADFETNSGDTVYSWSPTSGVTYVDGATAIAPGGNRIFETIWDGGGTDTYDLSNYASDLSIDLAPGGYSTFSGAQIANLGNGHTSRGNVFNALLYHDDLRSLIENALGGTGADAIAGNQASNLLDGGAGNDTLAGREGDDVLRGGNGDDSLDGGPGSDVLEGGAGNDMLDGGLGADHLDGGDGVDVALYQANTGAVRVDLVTGVVSFPGQNRAAHSITGVENVQGGAGNDVVLGDGASNTFSGNGGNDSLVGGNGADSLYGGGGNDTLEGGGQTDLLNGGAGSDTARYTSDGASVSVNLQTGVASFPGQSWPAESLVSIESVFTGSKADTLTGSSGANELHGLGGADRLVGAGGADRLVGGAGNDVFVFTANTSAPGARDVIAPGDGATAFQGAGAAAGDRIDLSGFDANTTKAGIQDWAFGTSHAKGHLWMSTSGTQTILNGNVDDDAAIEFQVAIDDAGVAASAYKVQDFIL